MKTICIGLFGTCNNSKWREEFIAQYEHDGIDYFNPDAGDHWHPGMIDDENRHLMEDNIILFPVLAESLGFGSLGEIGFSILNIKRNIENGSNQYLIVMIDDICTAELTTDAERDHSNRTRKLVKSKLESITHPNVLIVQNLDAMLIASLNLNQLISAYELTKETISKVNEA